VLLGREAMCEVRLDGAGVFLRGLKPGAPTLAAKFGGPNLLPWFATAKKAEKGGAAFAAFLGGRDRRDQRNPWTAAGRG